MTGVQTLYLHTPTHTDEHTHTHTHTHTTRTLRKHRQRQSCKVLRSGVSGLEQKNWTEWEDFQVACFSLTFQGYSVHWKYQRFSLLFNCLRPGAPRSPAPVPQDISMVLLVVQLILLSLQVAAVSASTFLFILPATHKHTLCHLECSESDLFFRVFFFFFCMESPRLWHLILFFSFFISSTYSFHLCRHFLPDSDGNSLESKDCVPFLCVPHSNQHRLRHAIDAQQLPTGLN